MGAWCMSCVESGVGLWSQVVCCVVSVHGKNGGGGGGGMAATAVSLRPRVISRATASPRRRVIYKIMRVLLQFPCVIVCVSFLIKLDSVFSRGGTCRLVREGSNVKCRPDCKKLEFRESVVMSILLSPSTKPSRNDRADFSEAAELTLDLNLEALFESGFDAGVLTLGLISHSTASGTPFRRFPDSRWTTDILMA